MVCPAFTWAVLSIDTSDPSQECLQVLLRLYLLMLADFVQGIERFKKAAAEVKDIVLGAQVGIFSQGTILGFFFIQIVSTKFGFGVT